MSDEITSVTTPAHSTWRHRVATCAAATLITVGALLAAPAAPAQAAIDGHITSSYGTAAFFSYGERLMACDTNADGHSVTAKLYTDNWNLHASVKDVDGAQMGCGEINLEIAEDTPLWLTLCVSDGLGCMSAQRVEA